MDGASSRDGCAPCGNLGHRSSHRDGARTRRRGRLRPFVALRSTWLALKRSVGCRDYAACLAVGVTDGRLLLGIFLQAHLSDFLAQFSGQAEELLWVNEPERSAGQLVLHV